MARTLKEKEGKEEEKKEEKGTFKEARRGKERDKKGCEKKDIQVGAFKEARGGK